MPANLSPEYKKAEQAYRAARDDRERLQCLRDMLRTIPKHKGTEHLQADLKSRIKSLGDELAGPRKGGARSGPVHSVRPEGAAQIALLGPPNAGKSSLHRALTGSRAIASPFPHATQEPMAGMCAYEDILFQLVDLPPISADYTPAWIASALQAADGALLVVDMADPECTDQIGAVLAELDARRITLTPAWPSDVTAATVPAAAPDADAAALDPLRIELPTLLVGNKLDLAGGPEDLDALEELVGIDFPTLAVAVETSAGLDAIAAFLFRALTIVRVYTKTPGKPPELAKPFTLRAGATVLDVAELVHRDIAGALHYARAWGPGVYDGQQVGPEHTVSDGDILELHMR